MRELAKEFIEEVRNEDFLKNVFKILVMIICTWITVASLMYMSYLLIQSFK